MLKYPNMSDKEEKELVTFWVQACEENSQLGSYLDYHP
jgi:hypothetical protein